ncbi:MAG: hypothetical protein MZW92_75910 [Comamonadaceae bacterium]|nr:hypothetical protein [Comamonadaceae bacterium]
MNRAYARFCMSLPRLALDNRQLLSGVFRRYYGSLAVIPGTYSADPFILTGKYLLLRKIAGMVLPAFHRGPLRVGLETSSFAWISNPIQATGRGHSGLSSKPVKNSLNGWISANWNATFRLS